MPGGAIATGGGLGGAERPENPWPGIFMTAFAAFGGILFGYDTGVISGVKEMNDWLCTFGARQEDGSCNITTGQESLTVSILSVGTFVGALLAAPVADFMGRRLGMVFSCLVFSIGVAFQTASTSLGLFIAGRIVAGMGVGLVSCLVPLYQSECSPKWIRGAVVACYQWAITIGLLIAACVNQGVKDINSHASYRIAIALQFVWAAILAGGMYLLPESPRWLILVNKEEQAKKSVARLLTTTEDDPRVIAELEEVKANLKQEQEYSKGGYLACFATENQILFRMLTGIFLQAWQQLTGINFIFYYGTTYFKASGISNPFLITIATNVVNVGMTIPGIWLIDRAGRRSLLLIGAAGMLVCEYLVAIIGVTISVENTAGQKVLIAFVCIYIAFFAATWGPIAWVVCGEIYPLQIRAKAMSLSTASNWLWNFGIGYATPYLVNSGAGNANLGSKVFFIWGSTCVGCLIFTFFCIPETKGLSLEQVDLLYQNTTPIKSLSYRRMLLEQDVKVADVVGGNVNVQDLARTYTGESGSAAHEKKNFEAEHAEVAPEHDNTKNV